MTPTRIDDRRLHRRSAHAGRRLLWRLAVMVLCAFVASFALGTAAELWHSFAGADPIAHAGGPPCPDPSDGDHPCGPACHCVCCHVPLAAPDLSGCRPSEGLVAFTALDEPLRDDLHPEDVPFPIFHPPRT
ncbi:MAG TPA: hypothetical protein PLU22_21495 [Polyangiaceae bacterium]|nr:hypothetical protein [Polyangiaceae bacterium]